MINSVTEGRFISNAPIDFSFNKIVNKKMASFICQFTFCCKTICKIVPQVRKSVNWFSASVKEAKKTNRLYNFFKSEYATSKMGIPIRSDTEPPGLFFLEYPSRKVYGNLFLHRS